MSETSKRFVIDVAMEAWIMTLDVTARRCGCHGEWNAAPLVGTLSVDEWRSALIVECESCGASWTFGAP